MCGAVGTPSAQLQSAPPAPLPPLQLLLFTGLFGAGLYLMCQASVGLDQELALPKVSCAL